MSARIVKRILLGLIATVVLIVVSGFLFLKSPVFGVLPNAADRERFAESPNYHVARQRFENRRPQVFDRMRENSSVGEMLGEWFQERPDGTPTSPLPESKPALDAFMADDGGNRVIWFGHSTFLLNLSGTTVLVDPILSGSAAPVSFMAKRFQPPVLSLDELPRIDIVLISHDHYDHLDKLSIEHFQDSPTVFVAPLGVGMHLERWGIESSRITERDWWQSHQIGELTFVAAPAQHFSGRDGINNNQSLWASWVIHTETLRLFFSGDSGYDEHFREIGQRLGPFDVAFMENGQYDKRWQAVHLLPEETAQAFQELNAQHLFPVHWGMFQLAFHTWYDPVVELSKAAKARGLSLLTPMIGDVLDLDGEVATDAWWEPLI